MKKAAGENKFRRTDQVLFAAHDGVNILVFLFLIALYYVGPTFHVLDYGTEKLLHLLGVMWFYAGLIVASFVVSRFIWVQKSLDVFRLANGYRFILVLELWCIPSIALIAYSGMVMVVQMGGLNVNAWAYQAYLFLLVSPPIMMIIPRLYHKRLIAGENISITREKRLAFWQDLGFIVLMTVVMGYLVASMIRKTALI